MEGRVAFGSERGPRVDPRVIIDGREKANKTKLSDGGYEAVAALAAKIADDPPPFASVDDFIQADLKP